MGAGGLWIEFGRKHEVGVSCLSCLTWGVSCKDDKAGLPRKNEGEMVVSYCLVNQPYYMEGRIYKYRVGEK